MYFPVKRLESYGADQTNLVQGGCRNQEDRKACQGGDGPGRATAVRRARRYRWLQLTEAEARPAPAPTNLLLVR